LDEKFDAEYEIFYNMNFKRYEIPEDKKSYFVDEFTFLAWTLSVPRLWVWPGGLIVAQRL